jgi:hypothetical protein
VVNRDAGDTGWNTMKILYFVEFGYAAWFVTSIILAHVAITRHIEKGFRRRLDADDHSAS